MAPKAPKVPKQQVPSHKVPAQLVWQLVKNYNCFLHKGLNGSRFSAEPGNLYNVSSYKYSGRCNRTSREKCCSFCHQSEDMHRLVLGTSWKESADSKRDKLLSACCRACKREDNAH